MAPEDAILADPYSTTNTHQTRATGLPFLSGRAVVDYSICMHYYISCMTLYSTSKSLASALLATETELIDINNIEAIRPFKLTIGDAITSHLLTERMFFALAPNRSERAKTYGVGNEDIDQRFTVLVNELSKLSRTGKCDCAILRDGEGVLESLIRGIEENVWRSKMLVGQAGAALMAFGGELDTAAAIGKRGSDRPLEPSKDSADDLVEFLSKPNLRTPNEIDQAQFDSLYEYQAYRKLSTTLDLLYDRLKSINKIIEKEGPSISFP